MSQVEVRLTGWMIADAMTELRIWLDHNICRVGVTSRINRLLDANSRERRLRSA